MNRETVDRLIAAFEAAPDPALARVIADALRTLGDEGEAARYEGAATRPRLRLVEKPVPDEVPDLARYRSAPTTFADVVGLGDVKQQIHRKIILPFVQPSLFARFRKRIGGGILMYGPPGCGKTLLARATAGECKAAFYSIAAADVLDMYIGESEQKIRALFDKARQQRPGVLFFDEFEALAGKREYARGNVGNNMVSQFLTELDGFAQNNEGILVLASTNVPWAIDPAFLRPGRFDRMFFVPPPDREAREAILAHHLRDRPVAEGIDVAGIARSTAGHSGADIANLVEMAADEAIAETLESGSTQPIASRHLQTALQAVRPTTTEWLTTARNYARYANDGGRYDEVLEFLKKHGR